MNDSENNITEPLNASGGTASGGADDDDAASQSSQRSGASLLERIRAQREREAQQQQQQQQQGNSFTQESTGTPSTIQVPQYSQAPDQNDHFATTGGIGQSQLTGAAALGASSFFSDAWNTINESMETGMASLQQDTERDGAGLEAGDALLAPSAHHHHDGMGSGGGEENYSIIGYFTTFVNDVYGTFLNLPLFVRVIFIFALLYSAFKLL